MTKIPGKHVFRVLGIMAVVSLFVAACGGSGGTSSGGGGGGGGLARVSGNVSAANARAGLDIEQRVFDSTGAIVAIGNFFIPNAHAYSSVAGIPVVVVCDGTPPINDVTDPFGNFDVGITVTEATNCTATFAADADSPELVVAFGMNPTTQTEVEVNLLPTGALELKRVRQDDGGTPGTAGIEVENDNDNNDNNDNTSDDDDSSSSSDDDDDDDDEDRSGSNSGPG